MDRLFRLPLFLALTGIVCASMIVPAVVAAYVGSIHDARSFLYSGIIGLVLTTFAALALAGRRSNRNPVRQLAALLAAFVFLPVVMAVPFFEAVGTTTFLNAYFEMVSSFTTTGATLFKPARLSLAEHLWRAQVGWMGGLLIWVSAAAVMAPLALGGFEITPSGTPGKVNDSGSLPSAQSDPSHRFARAAAALAPAYVGLTAALAVALMAVGDPPDVAVMHAMSTMATSGISPVGGLGQAGSGLLGEALIFLFLFFALSRLTFSSDTAANRGTRLVDDPELRVGLAIVLGVTLMLFVRHFIAALDSGAQNELASAARALWGSLFTVMSFVTTTGFESALWDEAQGWSGLRTPGILFMGLAIFGGGVATTAGGVKLLRVFALYLNASREVERLLHPSSLGHASKLGARIRKEGAFIAWVFFMMFALTLAAFSMIFGAFGVGFEQGLVLGVAGLTNTGPLIPAVADAELVLINERPAIKLLMCLAMVLGRLELLAIIAMLSPAVWRD